MTASPIVLGGATGDGLEVCPLLGSSTASASAARRRAVSSSAAWAAAARLSAPAAAPSASRAGSQAGQLGQGIGEVPLCCGQLRLAVDVSRRHRFGDEPPLDGEIGLGGGPLARRAAPDRGRWRQARRPAAPRPGAPRQAAVAGGVVLGAALGDDRTSAAPRSRAIAAASASALPSAATSRSTSDAGGREALPR